MVLEEFIAAVTGRDRRRARHAFDEVDASRLWPEALTSVLALSDIHPDIFAEFHSYWTVRGFRVRAAVANDTLVLDALHRLLPAYCGPSLELFRGENLDKWLDRTIGFGWTPKREVATMFGRGLAASEGSGGVLLAAIVPAIAIIAAPSAHSEHLGESEYTVDIRLLEEVSELERFPPSS